MRKTFIDWLLFRNQAAIRRRVLGAPNDLSFPLAPDVKRRRLGPEGLDAIQTLSIESLNHIFRQVPRTASERTMGAYATTFLKRIEESVESAKKDLAGRIEKIEAQMKSDEVITKSLAALSERADDIGGAIDKLIEAYHCSDEKPADATEGSLADDWRLFWA